MVLRAGRKIIWSENAISTRKSIYRFWIKRNKSATYSKKMHFLFLEAIEIVATYAEIALESKKKDIRLKLVRD